MKDKLSIPVILSMIGFISIVAFSIYQHVTLRDQIDSLSLSLDQAQKTVAEQEQKIQVGQQTLKERETEIARKEEQIRTQEQQIQDKEKQLQTKEADLRNQKSEVARQQEIANRLRTNTETLGVCLQGVSLAILATTPVEAATALGAIEAKCEEASEIVEAL